MQDGRAEGFDPRASTGLFVGVSSFEGFQPVPFAVDDAVDLAHLFAVELGRLRPKRVTLALSGEPRKEESRERLAALLELGAERVPATYTQVLRRVGERARASRGSGLFLFTVASHGITNAAGDFLLASDSLEEDMALTGLRLEWLLDRVAQAPARRRLVLLDACREQLSAGTRGVAGAPMEASFAAVLDRATGQAVLSGATQGGFAYDDGRRGNGVFTGAVLDGLRGAAPADAQGWITVRTLADYVQGEVVAWVRQHRPDHAEISRGIARRIEGEAEGLALTEHPRVAADIARYAERRAAALERLRENIGDIITGTLRDRIAELLPREWSAAVTEVEPLLVEIEALDGTERGQRSFRDYVREHHGEPVSTGSMPQPPSMVPVEPAPVPTAPDRSQRGSGARSGRLLPGSILSLAGAWLSVLAILVLLGLWLSGLWDPATQDPQASSPPPPSPEGPPLNPSGPGAEWKSPGEMLFHYVPPGTYTVGSDAAQDPDRYDWEWPRHEVQLTRSVWIGETEVTQDQWEALGLPNPSFFKHCGGDCPVEQISWFEAAEFANRLSKKEGLGPCYEMECTGTPGKDFACTSAEFKGLDCEGYRLPTETEWEVAARAGKPDPRYGPLNDIAWYYDNSSNTMHPVREKQPNDWQLHDMLGNVYEWCTDWYGPYDSNVPSIDRTGPVRGSNRVDRGGSWDSDARHVRAAYRGHDSPSLRWSLLGFRLARGQVLRSGEAEPGGR